MKFIKIDADHPCIKLVHLLAHNKDILCVERNKKVKYYRSIGDYCEQKGINPVEIYRKKLPLSHNGNLIYKKPLNEITESNCKSSQLT